MDELEAVEPCVGADAAVNRDANAFAEYYIVR